MTGLGSRLTHLERTLDSTQLVVRWLTEAQQQPTLRDYLAHLEHDLGANPLLALPAQIARNIQVQFRGERPAVIATRIEPSASSRASPSRSAGAPGGWCPTSRAGP